MAFLEGKQFTEPLLYARGCTRGFMDIVLCSLWNTLEGGVLVLLMRTQAQRDKSTDLRSHTAP